jgi:putative PEP-CTERM system histidine kinase
LLPLLTDFAGFYVHSFTALLLVLLAFLILLKERRAGSVSLAVGVLILALILFFDLFALRQSPDLSFYKRAVLFLKSLMPLCFLLYGNSFRKQSQVEFSHLPFLMLTLIGAALALGALVLPVGHFYPREAVSGGTMISLGQVGYWYYLGLMIFCVAALVNLEAVFASIRGIDRWRIKFEFLGVGSILGVFIFYFSQGLLYRSVNLALLPVRSGVLIVAALLIGYSRLFRGQGQKVLVSRYVFYRSFTLLAVGIYLLGLGLMGQFVRSFQISVSQELVLLVAFVSGIAFLALIFSEQIRRRVKLLVTKHFYAHKHDYRDQWLSFSSSLASCRRLEEVEGAIVEAFRRAYGLGYAALYARAREGDSYSLKAVEGRDDLPKSLLLSQGLRGYYIETGRVMNSLDGEYTPTPEEAEFIRSSEAWLLVPLMAGNQLEAVALLGSQIVTERLTYEDYDLMKLLGRQAVLSLNNFRLSEELAEAREMAAVAKVSSFVIHDLKNLAYTFSLMMDNAEDHIAEVDFQRDLVKSIRSTVAKMNGLIIKLKGFPQKQELRTETADIALLAREALGEVRKLKSAISFQDDCAPVSALVDVQEMKKVVLNLLLNACDALGEQGQVVLRTGSRDGEAFISVEDSGCGMSNAFVESQLFRPFRTTKEKGLGIGLYQCKQIVEAHGGRIEVESRTGEGTVFCVVLPKAKATGPV